MKKILSVVTLLTVVFLSGCASSGSQGGNTEVYGQVNSGYESHHH